MRPGAPHPQRCKPEGGRKIISGYLDAQRQSADDFAQGLSQWLRGDDAPEAEAAGILLAEVLLLQRAWVRAQMKDTGPQREVVIDER